MRSKQILSLVRLPVPPRPRVSSSRKIKAFAPALKAMREAGSGNEGNRRAPKGMQFPEPVPKSVSGSFLS